MVTGDPARQRLKVNWFCLLYVTTETVTHKHKYVEAKALQPGRNMAF